MKKYKITGVVALSMASNSELKVKFITAINEQKAEEDFRRLVTTNKLGEQSHEYCVINSIEIIK